MRLLLPLTLALLSAPAAAAQGNYECRLQRPLAGGTLVAEILVVAADPPHPAIVQWVAGKDSPITADAAWLIGGDEPVEPLLIAAYGPKPRHRDLAPQFQLRTLSGDIVPAPEPPPPDAYGMIRFAEPWDWFRDAVKASGALDLVVVLADGRVIARRRFQAHTLSAVEAAVAPAVEDLAPLLANPAKRCTDIGDMDNPD